MYYFLQLSSSQRRAIGHSFDGFIIDCAFDSKDCMNSR